MFHRTGRVKITKPKLTKCALVLLLVLGVGGNLNAQRGTAENGSSQTSTRQSPVSPSTENGVTVKLLDDSTKRIIANAPVEVRSNNGVRCRKALCPNNSLIWRAEKSGGRF